MIKNIIFDIGQVLVDFNWLSYIQSLGFTKEITKRVIEATVRNEIWNEQDRGDYDLEGLIELHKSQDPALEKEIRIFFEGIKGIVTERDYAPKLVSKLKNMGYQVYVLSNYGKYAFETARDSFQFLKEIDGGVISYEVGVVKPNAEIYQCLLEKYGLVPQECIFLDDRLENVEEAKRQGMYGIHFLSLEKTLEKLESLGVSLSLFL